MENITDLDSLRLVLSLFPPSFLPHQHHSLICFHFFICLFIFHFFSSPPLLPDTAAWTWTLGGKTPPENPRKHWKLGSTNTGKILTLPKVSRAREKPIEWTLSWPFRLFPPKRALPLFRYSLQWRHSLVAWHECCFLELSVKSCSLDS